MHFFNKMIILELNGSILPGITRKSCIELLRSWGLKVSERKISIQEISDANEKGLLKEAFGTGTAAVISPIGELFWNDQRMTLSGGRIGEISQRLYDELTSIQYCERPDPFGWIFPV